MGRSTTNLKDATARAKKYSIKDGTRSGSLVVVDGELRLRHGRRKRARADHYVLCLCEACGNPAVVRAYVVRLRIRRTCGCGKRPTPEDTTGMHEMFELLEILGHRRIGRQNSLWWKIRCRRCGRNRDLVASVVRKGEPCSCLNKIEYNGEFLSGARLAKKVGLQPMTLIARLRSGKSVEEAVKPVVKRQGRSRIRTKPLPPQVGQVFSNLTILEIVERRGDRWYYKVHCRRCLRDLVVSRSTLNLGACGRCSRRSTQANMVTVAGREMLLPDALILFELKESTYWSRVLKQKMSPEEALTSPHKHLNEHLRERFTS